jgi:nitrate/nitrite transporter NarK
MLSQLLAVDYVQSSNSVYNNGSGRSCVKVTSFFCPTVAITMLESCTKNSTLELLVQIALQFLILVSLIENKAQSA